MGNNNNEYGTEKDYKDDSGEWFQYCEVHGWFDPQKENHHGHKAVRGIPVVQKKGCFTLLTVLVVLLVFIIACSKQQTSNVSYPDTHTYVDQSVDLHTYLCMENDVPGWYIMEAAIKLNANGQNMLDTRMPRCAGWIFFENKAYPGQEGPTGDWGDTVYPYYRHVTIYLNPDVPEEHRLATTIHELGHALGLPHDDIPGSIMNIYENSTNPTKQNLQDIASQPWDWFKAYERCCK